MNSQKLPSVRLYLRFYGETFDPDEISRRLGIEPTTAFRPGDPIIRGGQGQRRRYGWMLKVGEWEALEINDLLPKLQDCLKVSAETVRQLCSDLNVEPVIICGVGMGDAETMPYLYFPTEFLQWLTELGASLDVDVIL